MTWKVRLLIGISLLCGLATFIFVDPVPQPQRYHDFADNRTFFGIPNAFDVLSNLPFLIFGLWGIALTAPAMARHGIEARRLSYLVYFVAFALVSVGSSVYHLWPDNHTLVWDRLPIMIAFMALFSAVVAELIDPRAALRLLPVFLLIGAFSVFYWGFTERIGHGDLRLYGLVQGLSVLLILLMLWLYRRPDYFLAYILAAAVVYGIAKVFEAFDAEVFSTLGVVSGHTLKHLFASGVGLALIQMLRRRAGLLDSPPPPAHDRARS